MARTQFYAVFELLDTSAVMLEKEGIFHPKIVVRMNNQIREVDSWNSAKDERASTMVLIPAEVTFEWSWIILDNKILRVKNMDADKSRTYKPSPTMDKIDRTWGRPTQMFISDTRGVEVTMNYVSSPGQYPTLTGGEPALANWNPYFGVEGREEFPSGSGKRRAQFILENLYRNQWMRVVAQGPNKHVARWEEFTKMIWMDIHVDRMEGRTLMEVKNHHDDIQTHLIEDQQDDSKLLPMIRENMDMDQMNDRYIMESNCKQEGKTKPTAQKSIYSLFGWIGNAVSSVLDLIE